jgi:dephospho-CoA kinase
VFADPVARKDLEAIVHPAVYRAMTAGIRAFELLGDSPLVIVDIPLLYETGAEKQFDAVIATVCPPETQIARLVGRGLSEADARLRLAAQWTAEEKASRANFVIRTDGSYEDTGRQVDDVLRRVASAPLG